MKISKNTLLGLGALTALAIASLFSFSAHKAAAQNAAFTPDQLSAARYRLMSNAEIQATIGGTIYVFIDANPVDGSHNFKARNTTMFCGGTVVGSGGIENALKGITLDTSFDALVAGGGDSLNAVVNLDYTDASGTCQNFQNPIVFTKQADGSFVGGTAPAAVGDPCTGGADCGTDGTCQKAGGDCTNQPIPDTCNDNAFGFSLTWLACPLLDAADSATNHIYTLFEDQLSFSIEQLGLDGQTQIQKSWSLMRDIATAMIVVVALIMVLSQAVSFGPFDAYTVRKMLPRIVAAVILIQISWVGVKFAIDIVNAIAQGIADLMYYPFGGADNMNLFALLGHAGLSNGTLTAINWAGLGVFIALGSAFLFTILGFAFAGILALLVALFTLIFRKILIILLIIFAPLAFLAWILPGTERYWKMWRENLIKVLFMFPIVVALIAAGRIFAYVVGAQPNNSLANSGHLMNLIFVLVGFFGPLFILPKTFKWGGQAMGLASGAISNAGTKVGSRPKAFFGKRQEGWSAERKRQSQERYTHDEKFNPRKIRSYWQRPIDLVRSGQVDPTLQGRRKTQAMRDYKVAGHESEEKDIKSANTEALMMIERTHPDEQDTYARALAAGQKVKVGKDGKIMAKRYKAGEVKDNGDTAQYDDELSVGADGKVFGAEEFGAETLGDTKEGRLERRAGLDQAARLGGEGNIDFIQKQFEAVMARGDAHEIEMMNQFTTANVGSLFAKLPHIYKNNNYAVAGREQHDVSRTVDGLNANDLTALSGAGIRTLRNELVTRATTATDPAERAKATASLKRLTTVFQQAASDPTIRGRLPADVVRAMHHLSTGSFTTDDKAVTPSNPSVSVGGLGLDKAVLDDIRSRTATDGVVRDARSGAAPVSSPGEIKIQHETKAAVTLPPPATISVVGSPEREVFKRQIQTSPEVVQTLANSIAYGSAPAEHRDTLREIRTEKERIIHDTTSTPEQVSQARREWNDISSQISHAYQRRLDEEVAHAVQSGIDPTTARTAAMSAADPTTGRTYAQESQDLQPGGTSPLSQLP